ncbi:MAG: hypothetical protein Q9222_000497 [Ikaeria aurantiellina]
MGGQDYLTRLALGRSAYDPLEIEQSIADPEQSSHSAPGHVDQLGRHVNDQPPQPQTGRPYVYIQQYDSRGRPVNALSRALSRQSRRAQNDVLATVGVLWGPDQGSSGSSVLPTSHDDHPRNPNVFVEAYNESDTGFWMSSAAVLTAFYVHDRITHVRHRFQTFHFYANVPFSLILETELAMSGLQLFCFAGLPGDVTARSLILLVPWVRSAHWLYNDWCNEKISRVTSQKIRKFLRLCRDIIQNFVWNCFMCAFVPIPLHAILQGLGFLPSVPFFPSLTAFVPFSTVSLIQPNQLPANPTFSSALQHLLSIAISPVFLWCVYDFVKAKALSGLWTHLPFLLPKPDTWYDVSLAVTDERGNDAMHVSGLHNHLRGVSSTKVHALKTREQAELDWQGVKNRLWFQVSWLLMIVTRCSPTMSIFHDENTPENPAPFSQPAACVQQDCNARETSNPDGSSIDNTSNASISGEGPHSSGASSIGEHLNASSPSPEVSEFDSACPTPSPRPY